jgi:hypothetical protein
MPASPDPKFTSVTRPAQVGRGFIQPCLPAGPTGLPFDFAHPWTGLWMTLSWSKGQGTLSLPKDEGLSHLPNPSGLLA